MAKQHSAGGTKKRRRRFIDNAFKTRVVLESLKEQEPLSALASRYEVHPNRISLWRKEFLASAHTVFSPDKESKQEIERLTEERDAYAQKVGELTMDVTFLKKSRSNGGDMRKEMVDRLHVEMSLTRQCDPLSLGRTLIYYTPQTSERNKKLMDRIDELFTKDPARGTRRLRAALKRQFGLGSGAEQDTLFDGSYGAKSDLQSS